ncbi:MAG TPA: thiolase family protein [Ignavibacteriaceae bacterium]|nr:thiolase family protein [Ignavibacteriaceae bacterium]
MQKVVITNAKRTPIGSFGGKLSPLSAPVLGSIAIKSLIDESEIELSLINEVIMGNVLTAGLGQAPARQAALFAGLPEKTECLTINKMCGSGLKAVMLAHQAIKSGDSEIIIAGGQENMSNAPYILQKARFGYKMGNDEIIDSLLNDGLWDVYNNIHMGKCAEQCAKKLGLSREEVDEYSILSYKRALNAQAKGIFKDEIVNVKIEQKEKEEIVHLDEDPQKVKFEKISSLKPVFDKNGIITAANASNLNDGSSALLVTTDKKAKELKLKPMVEIVTHTSFAKNPIEFPTAPADAIEKLLQKAKLKIDKIGLFEINEAFAVVSLAVNRRLKLNPEIVNVNGGAIALGHPIGASGARILTTLIYEMKRRDVEYGIAALCIGGGEASAVLVKNC